MEVFEGKNIKFNGIPAIRYCRGRDEYVLRVPDMYLALTEKVVGAVEVYIAGFDLWRMIKVDGFRGDLDDTTYWGIKWVQERYYLSKNTLDVAKRTNKHFKFSQWVILKRRVPRGGRPKGSRKISGEDCDRIQRMIEDYDRIVGNCIRHDWANEYVDLEREIAQFKGEKVPSRKKCLERFTELRTKNNVE